MVLNGGTFSTGSSTGFTETLDTLTLSSNSTLNLGTGSHQVTFADSSSTTWASGAILTIDGWTGLAGGSGTQGQIYFTTMGLTSTQLSQITFTGFGTGAMFVGSTDEITPLSIPEPATVFAGLALAGCVGWRERRRVSAWLAVRLRQPAPC
jgi:hypothetical protein